MKIFALAMCSFLISCQFWLSSGENVTVIHNLWHFWVEQGGYEMVRSECLIGLMGSSTVSKELLRRILAMREVFYAWLITTSCIHLTRKCIIIFADFVYFWQYKNQFAISISFTIITALSVVSVMIIINGKIKHNSGNTANLLFVTSYYKQHRTDKNKCSFWLILTFPGGLFLL